MTVSFSPAKRDDTHATHRRTSACNKTFRRFLLLLLLLASFPFQKSFIMYRCFFLSFFTCYNRFWKSSSSFSFVSFSFFLFYVIIIINSFASLSAFRFSGHREKEKEEKIHFHRHLDLRLRRRDDANRWEYIARPISDFMCGAPEL